MNTTRRSWFVWGVVLAGVLAAALQGAEIVSLKVPGGRIVGRVKKITDSAVTLVLQDGQEQAIPLQFLSKEDLAECQKKLIDPTDSKKLFELAEEFYRQGDKKQAYELFQRISALDPAARAKVAALLRGGAGSSPTTTSNLKRPLQSLQRIDEIHTEIYYQLSPAVVGIHCKVKGNPVMGYMGTGAVISPDGLILTSTTVIPKDPADIKVYFTDGYLRSAELVCHDPPSEGVLIKVTEALKDLPYMKLGKSDQYLAGEPVYSWGNPHDTISRDGTVSLSLGQISGQYYVSSVDDQSRYVGPVIETDAAVNPGSDGGPLTDANGNLLGIMSLAFSASRWLGLTIPTSKLVERIPQLQKLVPGQKPLWNDDKAFAWARELALQEAARKADPAVVGLWVVRADDKEAPPASFKDFPLTERKPYPNFQLRALLERNRPAFGGCVSGCIVEPEGTVITSAFNLDSRRVLNPQNPRQPLEKKATQIFAYLASGERVEAKLLGQSEPYDLAVLQLQGTRKNYPCLALAGAAPPAVGAAGALLGRSEPPGALTVNIGEVSALQRQNGLCLQISSLINYGNLGGPLVDLGGQLQGIAVHLDPNTAWRQNCGVGFCLKAERIQTVLADLKAGKAVAAPKRPHLGIQLDFMAQVQQGVAIKEVTPDSPAAKGGMQAGDVVTHFEGKGVDDPISLLNLIQSSEAGKTVKIKVLRKQTALELSVVVGEKGAKK